MSDLTKAINRHHNLASLVEALTMARGLSGRPSADARDISDVVDQALNMAYDALRDTERQIDQCAFGGVEFHTFAEVVPNGDSIRVRVQGEAQEVDVCPEGVLYRGVLTSWEDFAALADDSEAVLEEQARGFNSSRGI